MLIPGMPRNAVAHLDTLADCALLALHCFHCTAQCSRLARGYRCCSPLTHSFRCRHSTLPCLHFTAHRLRHRTKSSLELSSRPDFVKNLRHTVEHGKAVGQSVPPKPVLRPGIRRYTLAIVPHIGRVRPAYSAKSKKRFSKRLRRAVGGCFDRDKGVKIQFSPPLNPL